MKCNHIISPIILIVKLCIKIRFERLICFNFTEICSVTICSNRIGGVMVSMLALNAVDRGFEPRSDQTKD